MRWISAEITSNGRKFGVRVKPTFVRSRRLGAPPALSVCSTAFGQIEFKLVINWNEENSSRSLKMYTRRFKLTLFSQSRAFCFFPYYSWWLVNTLWKRNAVRVARTNLKRRNNSLLAENQPSAVLLLSKLVVFRLLPSPRELLSLPSVMGLALFISRLPSYCWSRSTTSRNRKVVVSTSRLSPSTKSSTTSSNILQLVEFLNT